MTGGHKNRLANEKSPYLLQHATNPVDWYPWGEEAFEKARREDKPVFLSIGYSTCHWCHVMEHESFEDPEVARLMNETFVSIKVDREERPDVDGIYMTVCQMLTGSGGWPLTIVMTPDKKPFFAGTYFPKDNRFGRPGMLELIPKIGEIWKTRRDEAIRSAAEITTHLVNRSTPSGNASPDGSQGLRLEEGILKAGYEELADRFDPTYGGFGGAPKFPTPHTLLFLLRYGQRSGEPKATAMVEKTLHEMRRGGIYDPIGFGFHRYSTDAQWLVPHYEKMLYDQALLAIAYLEAFQKTGRAEFAQTAREVFTYLFRDMTSPEGGFFSAEDADSEGEEGKFYRWEGKNILDLAKRADWEETRKKLFETREKRVHPHKDDKILTDWNGLMISALARGAQVLNEPKYAEAAGRAVDFILKKMRRKDGRLLHRYRDGEAAVPGQLDDYSFLIGGLLDLYETTFDLRFLQTALDLNRQLIQHFWDPEAGGLFFTADDAEPLLIRQKEGYDGAVPSGNAVATLNWLRLGRMTAQDDLEKKAEATQKLFASQIRQAPSAHAFHLMAVDFAIGPTYEIVIAGDPAAPDTRAMLQALRGRFVPNKVVLLRPPGMTEITRIAPFTQSQVPLKGKATAYVCQNFACHRPTTEIKEMLALIR